MRVLVTGATGFLGRSLVRRLTSQGHLVTALVRSRQRPLPDPVEELRGYGADIVMGTLFDAGPLASAIADCEAVFHLAWQWHRPSIPDAPPAGTGAEQWHVNVEGARLLIAAAQQAGVKRLVFTSSIAVYPADLASPIAEAGPTFAPDNVGGTPNEDYVRPKLAVEEMIRHLLPAPDYAILRPAIIYGTHAQWAPGMIRGILNRPPRRQMVQPTTYTHVDDVARAALLAAEMPAAKGMTMNIAARDTIGSDELRDAIHQMADRLANGQAVGDGLVFHPITPRYDTGVARHCLGYETEIELAHGLEKMIAAALPQVAASNAPSPGARQWGGRRFGAGAMPTRWGGGQQGAPWRPR